MKINERWHRSNVMPKNATLEQRLGWHETHAKACGCRPIPQSLQEELTRRARARKRAE